MLVALSVTVNVAFVVPESPSATVMSLTAIVGPSSSEIVPTPCASEIVAFVAFVRFRSSVSSSSSIESVVSATLTVSVVTPGEKLSVPLRAV